MPVAVKITAIVSHVTPVRAPIAAVTANIAPVLTDVARFLPRRGGVARSHVLTTLTPVLPDVTTVAANVAGVPAHVAAVVTEILLIACRIAGLLRTRHGGYTERQRKQRGEKSAALHSLVLEKGCKSWFRREQDSGVKTYGCGTRGT